ncbi:NADH:flavin oxidoreductase [Pseudahrensia aquimaris]|uniref:NADH:flavin oxidoreductase n=1 Tax=Pseudahrensia aquimaris TaxID=744461 RepID=A0ABW3F9Z5_9HYPH
MTQTHTDATDILFQPFKLKSLAMQNRVVMAPMTRVFSPGGVPKTNVADYYRRRAAGDVGLILSEGTVIDRPTSKNEEGIPDFHGQEALAGWKQVIDGVHEAGGKMGPQIWHTGSNWGQSKWVPPHEVESPSGLIGPDNPRGKAMSDEDVTDTIAAYAKAAGEAKSLGFDMVELHGAHGYLIDQFFWEGTNLRDDRWGGATLKERSRFAAEVVKATRAAVGDDFPIALRVSQWKQQDYKVRLAETPDAMTDWLMPLVEAGADMLHCSQRRFWEPEFPEIDGAEGLNFAGWVKKLTGATTISVGSVGLSGDFFGAFGGKSSQPTELDGLVQRMERDEFDLIAVGRAILADPNWVSKVKGTNPEPHIEFKPEAFAELT